MLHNPSTANAEQDDPTSRRGIGFAQRWNAGRMVFVNPFAGIATQPIDLWKMDDPVGPDNTSHIAAVALEVTNSKGFFVFAWGAISPPAVLRDKVREHLHDVEVSVRAYCVDIRCFGRTQSGDPRHPLYLRNDTCLQNWSSYAD